MPLPRQIIPSRAQKLLKNPKNFDKVLPMEAVILSAFPEAIKKVLPKSNNIGPKELSKLPLSTQDKIINEALKMVGLPSLSRLTKVGDATNDTENQAMESPPADKDKEETGSDDKKAEMMPNLEPSNDIHDTGIHDILGAIQRLK